MRLLDNIFPLHDFLYLLQLEEYDSLRYARLLPRFFFRRQLQVRDTLKITKRIHQMRIVCILLMFLAVSVAGSGLVIASDSAAIRGIDMRFVVYPVAVMAIFSTTPLFILLTNLLMTPWYNYLKRRKQNSAAQIIRYRTDLKIIAITGSYGKTTVKTALYQMLKNSFRVQHTPGNINTPTGITQWLIDKLQPNTQVLIVEMDAYSSGEVARSCAITPPDIALITNFGDQHLERFGSHQNLTLAYLEVFTHAKPQASLMIDTQEYSKILQYEKTKQIVNNLTIEQFNNHLNLSLPNFSPTAQQNINYAIQIALKFQIPTELIDQAIKNLQLPDRRGDTKLVDGYTVIDNSYNISAQTANTAVQEAASLAKKTNKQLTLITAGIPERGSESYQVNNKYGQLINDYAKYIIILQSIYAPAIQAGISDPAKILKACRMHEALEIAKSLGSPSETIILMQPELTDLSY